MKCRAICIRFRIFLYGCWWRRLNIAGLIPMGRGWVSGDPWLYLYSTRSITWSWSGHYTRTIPTRILCRRPSSKTFVAFGRRWMSKPQLTWVNQFSSPWTPAVELRIVTEFGYLDITVSSDVEQTSQPFGAYLHIVWITTALGEYRSTVILLNQERSSVEIIRNFGLPKGHNFIKVSRFSKHSSLHQTFALN